MYTDVAYRPTTDPDFPRGISIAQVAADFDNANLAAQRAMRPPYQLQTTQTDEELRKLAEYNAEKFRRYEQFINSDAYKTASEIAGTLGTTIDRYLKSDASTLIKDGITIQSGGVINPVLGALSGPGPASPAVNAGNANQGVGGGTAMPQSQQFFLGSEGKYKEYLDRVMKENQQDADRVNAFNRAADLQREQSWMNRAENTGRIYFSDVLSSAMIKARDDIIRLCYPQYGREMELEHFFADTPMRTQFAQFAAMTINSNNALSVHTYQPEKNYKRLNKRLYKILCIIRRSIIWSSGEKKFIGKGSTLNVSSVNSLFFV